VMTLAGERLRKVRTYETRSACDEDSHFLCPPWISPVSNVRTLLRRGRKSCINYEKLTKIPMGSILYLFTESSEFGINSVLSSSWEDQKAPDARRANLEE
jgi:hypothetical protein